MKETAGMQRLFVWFFCILTFCKKPCSRGDLKCAYFIGAVRWKCLARSLQSSLTRKYELWFYLIYFLKLLLQKRAAWSLQWRQEKTLIWTSVLFDLSRCNVSLMSLLSLSSPLQPEFSKTGTMRLETAAPKLLDRLHIRPLSLSEFSPMSRRVWGDFNESKTNSWKRPSRSAGGRTELHQGFISAAARREVKLCRLRRFVPRCSINESSCLRRASC